MLRVSNNSIQSFVRTHCTSYASVMTRIQNGAQLSQRGIIRFMTLPSSMKYLVLLVVTISSTAYLLTEFLQELGYAHFL
jgi:hypothetical protein